MLILAILLSAVLSYLLGSFNSSILVVRLLKHKDIRDYGSHNAGLTNTLRCFGKGCAALTLVGDLAKGIIAVPCSHCPGKAGGAGGNKRPHSVCGRQRAVPKAAAGAVGTGKTRGDSAVLYLFRCHAPGYVPEKAPEYGRYAPGFRGRCH